MGDLPTTGHLVAFGRSLVCLLFWHAFTLLLGRRLLAFAAGLNSFARHSGLFRLDHLDGLSARIPEGASGVLFAMGGYAGGVSLYAWNGELRYEYSSLLIRRTHIDVGRLPVGDVRIEMEMRTPPDRAAPAELTFWIDGDEVASGTVDRTVPMTFTASETFDIGRDTSSPVADDYFDDAPFPFDGTIERMRFQYLSAGSP